VVYERPFEFVGEGGPWQWQGTKREVSHRYRYLGEAVGRHVRPPLCRCQWRIYSFINNFMSQKLEYQECYHQFAHEAAINTMAISPDGHRFLTGSDDSTVLVWSTRSGVALCHIKAHSPVVALAWLPNSEGFIFGCKNGILASVDITKVRWVSV